MQNKNESTAEEIAAKRTELDNMESMSFRRVCVDDVTPEALVKLLKENETLLMLSDEAEPSRTSADDIQTEFPMLTCSSNAGAVKAL